jgi:hypothetical protein
VNCFKITAMVAALASASAQAVWCNFKDLECLKGYILPGNTADTSVREWAPISGSVKGYGKKIEVKFKLDSQSMQTLGYTNSWYDIRNFAFQAGFAFEVDISEASGGSSLRFDRSKIRHSTSLKAAGASLDTDLFDSINKNGNAIGLIIQDARYLQAGEEYYVAFFLQDPIPPEGASINLSFQISANTKMLQALTPRGLLLPDFILGGYADKYDTFALEGESYKKDGWKVYPDGRQGLCWSNKSASAACPDPTTPPTAPPEPPNVVNAVRIAPPRPFGTTVLPTSAPPIVVSYPDFLVKKLSLHTPWGPESYKYGMMESINTKAQSGNTGEGSCLAGESSTIIGHFYLSKGYKEDAHGDWRKVDSTETKCSNLKPGDTNTETKNTVISDWITTPGIYNVVYCIDHPKTEQNNGGDHAEKHESNNCSTEAVFEVTGNSYENTTNIDLVASQLQFRGTPPVYAADSIRLGAWITNAGTQGLYTDIRSSYGLSCNGSPQIQLADDGTEAKLLGPGMNAWEEILSPATLPNVSGSCVATFCADHAYMVNEVNKANNCTSLGFNLLPRTNLPDLITHSAGIAGGKTRVKAGDKIVPAFYTQNIGNTRPSVTTQALFQYRGPQTGNLWVNLATEVNEAKYLDPGKQRRGEWSNGFRISTRGLYQFQICADYLLQQPEISESNNCSVSGWFEVY